MPHYSTTTTTTRASNEKVHTEDMSLLLKPYTTHRHTPGPCALTFIAYRERERERSQRSSGSHTHTRVLNLTSLTAHTIRIELFLQSTLSKAFSLD